MPSTKIRRRGLKSVGLALALGVAGHAAHAVFDLGGPGADDFFDIYLYLGLIMAGAAVCGARALAVRAERGAWVAMTIGLTVSGAGFIVGQALAGPDGNPPFPSIADALYLTFYPATYVTLVLLARGRMRKIEFGVWLDGVIVGLTLAAIAAAVVFQPIVDATSGSPATVATTLSYPVGDLALLIFIAVICTATGFRPGRSFALIGLGLLMGMVADSAYAYLASAGNYPEGSLLDTLYPASAVLTGFAAWQRKSRRRPVTATGGESLPVFATSAVFTMIALGLVIFDHYVPLTPLALWLASAAIVVGVARAVSMHIAKLRALRRAEVQALTDGLTEIGNRRRLMADLELAFQPAHAARARTLAFYDLDGFKNYNDLFGHSAGDALLVRLARALGAAVAGRGTPYRLGGDEFCVLLDGDVTGEEQFLESLTAALGEGGDGFTVTCSAGVVAMPREAAGPEAALQLADKRMYEHKGMDRRSAAHQAKDVLMQTLLEQEPDLHEHMIGVAQRAEAVARSLGLDAETVDEVRRGAQLHDVGKIAIPAEILHKPGPLDAEEWKFMRQHTVIGERIVSAAPALVPVARIVRLSHERYDGSGYPDQLSRDEIPIGASIVGVCDAYDAMTSDRAYRKGMSRAEALAEIRCCSGSQFDPVVADAFLAIVEAEATSQTAGNGRAGGESGPPDPSYADPRWRRTPKNSSVSSR